MFRRRKFKLRLPSRTLLLGERTLVMGVLNVTPDSFSDGALFLNTDAAVARALEIERAGADIIDIGGEYFRFWKNSEEKSKSQFRWTPASLTSQKQPLPPAPKS